MKICCVSMTSLNRVGFSFTWHNLSRYARRHGYGLHLIMVEDGEWEYKKHEAFEYLFNLGYDLIWYKDDDAIVTNMSIKIESFINDQFDLFLTRDLHGVNGGSLVMKNTEWGNMINKMILNNRDKYGNEQDYFNANMDFLLNTGAVGIAKHPTFHSFKYSLYPECKEGIGRPDLGDWEEGKSFMLHVPALSHEQRIEILKNTPIIE